MRLIDLPPSHIVRRLSLTELRTLYPDLCTVNDLLNLTVTREMPPRDLPTTGLLDKLSPKHPKRRTPLADLRAQYYDLRTNRWISLRRSDKRAKLTYNELPDLQRWRYIWRYRL